jgi:hypothetical protein
MATYVAVKNQADYLAGVNAVRIFFNASLDYRNGAMSQMSFDQFLDYCNSMPFSTRIVENIGYAANKHEIHRVEKTMKELASEYQGRVPDAKGMSQFMGAIADDILSISYRSEIVIEGVKKTASDIGKLAVGGVALYAIGALVVLYIASQRRTA